jgi:hypothetical protein
MNVIVGRVADHDGLVLELGGQRVPHFDEILDAPPSRQSSEAAAGPAGLPIGHSMITARLEPVTAASPGGSLPLLVDPARLHFFDRETERAIAR